MKKPVQQNKTKKRRFIFWAPLIVIAIFFGLDKFETLRDRSRTAKIDLDDGTVITARVDKDLVVVKRGDEKYFIDKKAMGADKLTAQLNSLEPKYRTKEQRKIIRAAIGTKLYIQNNLTAIAEHCDHHNSMRKYRAKFNAGFADKKAKADKIIAEINMEKEAGDYIHSVVMAGREVRTQVFMKEFAEFSQGEENLTMADFCNAMNDMADDVVESILEFHKKIYPGF